ncbi:MAG: hypothetical protein WAO07_17980 [Desulfobacterales bacterium]
MAKAEDKLSKLKAKSTDTAESLRTKADKIVQACGVAEYLGFERLKQPKPL